MLHTTVSTFSTLFDQTLQFTKKRKQTDDAFKKVGDDVTRLISSFLPIVDHVKLSQTSKHFQKVCSFAISLPTYVRLDRHSTEVILQTLQYFLSKKGVQHLSTSSWLVVVSPMKLWCMLPNLCHYRLFIWLPLM